MIAFVLVWMACAAPPSDAEVYLAASQNPAAPDACQAIRAPNLRSECLAMSAADLARQQGVEAGTTRCAQIAMDSTWRPECYFLIADAVRASGQQAQTLCAQAGPFAERCLGHAFGREGRALLFANRGQERATMKTLRERAAVYFPAPQEATRRVRQLVIQSVSMRDPDAPFSRATCGDLGARLCGQAYELRVRNHANQTALPLSALAPLCAQDPITAAAAIDVGAPAWAENADAIVQPVWARLCVQVRGG